MAHFLTHAGAVAGTLLEGLHVAVAAGDDDEVVAVGAGPDEVMGVGVAEVLGAVKPDLQDAGHISSYLNFKPSSLS